MQTEEPFRYFNRYRSIIDDWDRFCEAGSSPLPACIWTNTLKTTPERLSRRIPASPLAWYEGAFRCRADIKPSHQAPYLAGHYLIQEEAAMLPVRLLDPQPGELVLDLCAAPGNKTAQMAVKMNSTGLIVANDRNEGRLGILRRAINRLGLTNVGLTLHDAAAYPGEADLFDRVLADVPCSGEGTLRRRTRPAFSIPPRRRALLKHIQTTILTRAYKLCRPGGWIVYATCTFAPEENEAIVDAILRRYPGRLQLVGAPDFGLRVSPGLTRWKDARYHPDMHKTVRLWPHHNDTGGFFSALLRKTGPIPDRCAANTESAGEVNSEESRAIDFLKERFGIPRRIFRAFDIRNDDERQSNLVAPHAWPDSIPAPLQRGLPFIRFDRKIPKLKTGAAMMLASFATRHVLDLTRQDLLSYAGRESFVINPDRIDGSDPHGYVLLRYEGMNLGLGFLRVTNGGHVVESLLPKHWLHAELECR